MENITSDSHRGNSADHQSYEAQPQDDPFGFEYGPDLAVPPPPPCWVCKELGIARGRPSLLVGCAGTIKSWLAEELALAVAAGQATIWGGVPIQLSGVVRFFDYENIAEVSARRLQRLAAARGIDLASLGSKLGRAAMPRVYLTDNNAEEAFTRACQGVALAIIDSLRAACPGVEENDSKIREFIDLLNRVTQRTGTVFLIIHHEGKGGGASGKGTVSPGHHARGSSAIVDAAESSIRVTAGSRDTFRVERGKLSTRKADAAPLTLRLRDEGKIDPESGLSREVRIEQVECGHDRAAEEPDRNDEIRAPVLQCIADNPGIAGTEAVRKRLRVAAGPVRAAVARLIKDGAVVERTGDGGRGRLLFVASAAEER